MSDPVPDEDEDHGGEGGDGDSDEDADRRPQEGRLVPVIALGGTLYHGVGDLGLTHQHICSIYSH